MVANYAWFPVDVRAGHESCLLRICYGEDVTEYHLEGLPYLVPQSGQDLPLLGYRHNTGSHYLVALSPSNRGQSNSEYKITRRLLGTSSAVDGDRVPGSARVYVLNDVLYSGCYAGRMARISVSSSDLAQGMDLWQGIPYESAPLTIGSILDMECGGSIVWRTLETKSLSARQAFLRLQTLRYVARIRDQRVIRIGSQRFRLFGYLDLSEYCGYVLRTKSDSRYQFWLLNEDSLQELANAKHTWGRWHFTDETFLQSFLRPCSWEGVPIPCTSFGTFRFA